MGTSPKPWSVIAQNLPEHAGNKIHTDEGARAAGFPGALVAGVTTYAYLCHPIVAAWGLDWIARGGAEVRFRSPVLAGDRVDCVPTPDDGDGDDDVDVVTVEAQCAGGEPGARAVLRASRDGGPRPAARPGEVLRSRQFVLAGEYGADYGRRAGDDLDLFEREGVVHPAVWPALANQVMAADLVRGPWIHTRSAIRHHAPAPAGATVDLHAIVVDRFERRGRRAVVDIVIEHDGVLIATLEHEAIVELTPT